MRLVGEAAMNGDIAQWRIRQQHEMCGAFDATAQDEDLR